MEESITEGVRVNVEAIYMETHSYPEKDRYVFAYRIRLKNFSQRTVQLLRRHWIITDSNGETNEVHGEGVVGEQPVQNLKNLFPVHYLLLKEQSLN